MKRRGRITLSLSIALIAVGAFSWLQYRQSILPVIGGDPLTAMMITDDIASISSPDESHVLYITVLDAGATHSGNFRTLVTMKDWLHGRRVAAEGYVSWDVRYKRVPFPYEWTDEKTCVITFDGEPTEKKVLVRFE